MQLNEPQRQVLDIVLNAMIPPAPERSLPGAKDVGVWDFIMRLASHEADAVVQDLEWIEAQAQASLGMPITQVDGEQAAACLATLRKTQPERFARLTRLTLSCYYQHEDVLKGIGMDPRPPFPLGYTVAPGDLSLLEPVKQRGPVFRKV